LKRDVNAAFGAQDGQKSKRSRRKRLKALNAQHEPLQDIKSTGSHDKVSNSHFETAATPVLSPPAETNLQRGTKTQEEELDGGKQHRQTKRRLRKHRTGPELTLSSAEGGRFTNHDPILAQGDR
jgi:hypothetical protein